MPKGKFLDLHRHLPSTAFVLILMMAIAGFAGAFIYGGIGYALARSFCELFREPDVGHWFTVGPFTAGILYSLPMILFGIIVIRMSRRRAAAPAPADVQR